MPQKTNNSAGIVFPQEAGDLIEKILKKYNLEESAEEIFEKKKNKTTSSTILLAKLTKKIATQQITIKEAKQILKQGLALTAKKASDISQEVEAIAGLARSIKLNTKTESKPKLGDEQKTSTRKIPTQEDVYREPVE